MKENWTDFEKYAFNKFEKIDNKITKLEIIAATRGAMWGAASSVVVAVIGLLAKGAFFG